MIRTRTKFDKTVEKINHADVFLSQEKMYQELENYIEDHRVREAVLIQYSGQRVNRIVRQLVSQGADVILYVQAKETAQKFSNHQVDRIKQFPDFIVTEFDESAEKKKNKGTLIIHEYDPPASLRAIRIDNKILGIGWYVYTYIDKKDVKEKQQYQKFPDDDIKLLGHNQPGKLLYSGSREYDIMSILFEHFVENVDKHNKLWGKDPIFEFGTEPHE